MPHSRRLRPCRAERSQADHSSRALSVMVAASIISFGGRGCSGSGYDGNRGGRYGVSSRNSSGRSSRLGPVIPEDPPGTYREPAPSE